MARTDSSNEGGIGHRIRETRKSLGLRQTDLSRMTGLPASHLSDIERQVLTPTIPTLRTISQALDRPLEYFLQEDTGGPRSMGMVIHASSIAGQAAARFAQLVEEKTDGEIRVHMYQRAALGTAREQVQALAEGAIHLYVDEPLSFELYAELCGSVFLPFFFRDREHYHRFLRSSSFQEHIYQKLLDNNVRLLNPASNWECGSFELLFSTKPIFWPADLAGRRMRTYTSEAAIALRRALGATPVMVEWENIYEAFEGGLIDTLLVPAAYFESLEMHKLAEQATFLDCGYTLNTTVAMNEPAYRTLSPSVQHVLSEAVEEAGTYCCRLANTKTLAHLRSLSEEHGVPVIHPQQGAWRQAFEAAIREICAAGLLPPGIYDELQSL